MQATNQNALKAAIINASTDAEEENFINIVEYAAMAFGNIQAARFSISNGKPEEAAVG